MQKKVVLDTNVLISYIDSKGEGFQALCRILEKCHELKIVSCEEILNELFITLSKRKKLHVTAARMITRIIVITLEKQKKIFLLPLHSQKLDFDINVKDKKFCEFAIQHQVDYLITDDSRHFNPIKSQMKKNHSVSVITCSEFLEKEGHVEEWDKFKGYTLFG